MRLVFKLFFKSFPCKQLAALTALLVVAVKGDYAPPAATYGVPSAGGDYNSYSVGGGAGGYSGGVGGYSGGGAGGYGGGAGGYGGGGHDEHHQVNMIVCPLGSLGIFIKLLIIIKNVDNHKKWASLSM
ncbi:hypothetical protein O3M35_005775 [Rhynocoris fuscipes]|uniref:Uncharacterized protein n=1 Tax=Rhynocoris fuscipes TaxID=488301 RepID=A0AAW1DKQ1_9HEMI